MSIASRIQEIETHIGDVYDTINYSYDTTGINKNIINIPKYLKKGYIDIINNGIDTLYNNFPKVSGIGSNLSLTPTYEAPMKLNEIQGDTLQNGTPTPDTPVPIENVTGNQEIKVTGKNLFNINGTITQGTLDKYNNGFTLVKGTNRVIRFVLPKVLPAGTYTLSYDTINVENVSGNYFYVSCQYTNTNIGILNNIILNDSGATFTTTGEFDRLYFFIAGNQSNDATITIDNVQLEKSSTATSYEPYKGNTYEVNLGKNIWSVGNKNVSWATNYVDVKNILNTLSEGTYSITLNFKVTEIVKEKTNNLYGFTFHNSNGHIYNKKNTNSNINVDDIFTFVYTFTISSSQVGNFTNAYFYGFGNDTDDVTAKSLMYDCQLEKGSQATSYSPYFTPIELNKIGDYKDSIKKSTGINLFDKNAITDNKWLLANGNEEAKTSYCISDYIPVIAGEQYYLQNPSSRRLKYYDINKQALTTSDWDIASTENQVLTIPSNAYYVRITIYKTNVSIDTYQFEKGTTASPYEPYGKVWYVEKQIGKVVLDGSESGWSYNDVNQVFIVPDLVNYLRSGFVPYSNYYQGQSVTLYNQVETNHIAFLQSTTNNRLLIKNLNYTGVTAFKTWLSTHNTEILYVLATPEYTEITNTELIEDLETLYTAKSQDGTTNISITSEDLEMILNVSALKGDA